MTVGKDSFWVSWGNGTGEMEKANKTYDEIFKKGHVLLTLEKPK